MGIYLNPSTENFQKALNSEIYIDKSMIIDCINKVVNTQQQYICVSRPRRFGKSITAEMISAYYGKGNSHEIFKDLKISKAQSYEKYINKFDVIHINMQSYLSEAKNIDEMLEFIEQDLIEELMKEYAQVEYPKRITLVKVLATIFATKGKSFVFVIDEWDSIFRVYKNDKEAQARYLDFLRNLLKDQSYVSLAYMTGILPIKKYGQHSALNMFTEVSMTDPREYAVFTGFTEEEVSKLCKKYNMSLEETKKWYDGYNLKGVSIYNPRSVVMSMTGGYFNNYWTQTETYEALKVYIQMNYARLEG